MGAAGGDRYSATCPDCGRVFPARTLRGANGAVRMHRCEGRRREQHLDTSGGPTGPRTCDHAWRLLSGVERREAAALRGGYAVVCQECGLVERAGVEVG